METKEAYSYFNYENVVSAVIMLIKAIGEDPTREGLIDTPRRVADFWKEFVLYDPGNCETNFEVEQVNQMVVVSGIKIWSLCEHHLLPFYCNVTIGYLTKSKVIGLSKFARVAQSIAHHLQLQERLVSMIADEVIRLSEQEDVGVIAKGQHLCMEMRGIKTPATMISSSLHGVFLTDPTVRNEFLTLSS